MAPSSSLLASSFLGLDNSLLTWLLLAFGAAMVVGNLAALFKPPGPEPGSSQPRERPPIGRTLVFALVGAVASIWALASLIAK
jgi:hypothetical protein